MLVGARFRLKRKIIAAIISQKEELQYIPQDELVEVVREPHPDASKFVDVRWNGTDYAVFATDLADRGKKTQNQQIQCRPLANSSRCVSGPPGLLREVRGPSALGG